MTTVEVDRLSEETKTLLALAFREALSRGSDYTEPEHILFALLRLSRGGHQPGIVRGQLLESFKS